MSDIALFESLKSASLKLRDEIKSGKLTGCTDLYNQITELWKNDDVAGVKAKFKELAVSLSHRENYDAEHAESYLKQLFGDKDYTTIIGTIVQPWYQKAFGAVTGQASTFFKGMLPEEFRDNPAQYVTEHPWKTLFGGMLGAGIVTEVFSFLKADGFKDKFSDLGTVAALAGCMFLFTNFGNQSQASTVETGRQYDALPPPPPENVRVHKTDFYRGEPVGAGGR